LIVALTGCFSTDARASESSDALVAAEAVRTYYIFQGVEASGDRLTAGLPVALELVSSGWSHDTLDAMILQLFRERDSARSEPFETEVAAWMRDRGTYLAVVLGVPAEPADAPLPVDDEPAAAATERFTDESEAGVQGEHPETQGAGGWADPATVDEPVDAALEEEPTLVDGSDVVALVEEERDPDETREEPASSGRWDDESDEVAERVVHAEVRLTTRRVGISKPEGAGLLIVGSGLLVGGMAGGAGMAAECAKVSLYSPGYTPLIGLIPFVGPGAGYEYWRQYGNQYSVQPYAPVAAVMTALEIAGATLIIIGAAAPRRDQRSSEARRRRHFERFAIVPSVSPSEMQISIHARF